MPAYFKAVVLPGRPQGPPLLQTQAPPTSPTSLLFPAPLTPQFQGTSIAELAGGEPNVESRVVFVLKRGCGYAVFLTTIGRRRKGGVETRLKAG